MAFTYKAYTESNAVKNAKKLADQNSKYTQSKDVSLAKTALDKHEKTKVADWTGGTYGESVKQAMDKINNREKFSYDLAGDALYQQYKDQYINLGKMAMADTVGQAASLTGGYANSYAATAGNQAYQNYLTQLNDVVPELYQMAADRYDQEGNELYRQLDMYNQAYGTEYGEYRDRVSDWYNEDERLSSRYYNEANMDWNRFADNRDYYTSAYRDIRDYQRDLYDSAYDKALEQYKQKIAEQQWQKEYELKKSSASSSGGGGGGGRSSGRSSGGGDSQEKLSNNDNKNIATYASYLYGEGKDAEADAVLKDNNQSDAAKQYAKAYAPEFAAQIAADKKAYAANKTVGVNAMLGYTAKKKK